MSDETTQYKVDVLYDVTDKASKAMEDIARHADSAARHVGGLSSALHMVAGLFLGHSVLGAAKHWFINFNQEVQDAKIGLSAMLQGNLGGSWQQATSHADALYNEFQKFSTLTPVTTQQMMQFGRGTAMAVFGAGGSIKQFINVTEQGVVAAKALGQESGYAAREIAMMLGGNVSHRMLFAQQLLGMMGMDEKHFKALSGGQRLAAVQKVLNSDAMKNATGAFATSFSGVTSTLEDKLQILLGKVGLPLFKAITAEVASWNKWLEDNQDKVDRIAKEVGGDLVKGFHFVKDVFAFVYDHSDTFIEIGRVWAAIKIGQFAMGQMSGLAGAAGGVFGGAGKPGSAGRAGAAAGAFEVGWLIGEKINETNWGGLRDGIGDVVQKFGQVGHAIGLWSATFDDYGRTLAERGRKIDEDMAAMDASVENAHARLKKFGGAFGTDAAARLMGLQDDVAAQLGAAKKMLNEIQSRSGSTGNASNGFGDQREFYLGGGADSAADKLYSAVVDGLTRRQQQLYGEAYANPAAANAVLIGGMAQLNATQLAHLKVAEATEAVMAEVQREMAQGLPIDMKKIKAILDANVDMYGARGGRRGGNTNVHIDRVEVAAKDPNRWIMELDAAVHAKIRAPSRPKRALRSDF